MPELFTAEGLVGGACRACGRRHFPLALWCPWCGTADPARVRLSTRGRLWSWTAVLSAPPGYEGDVPYGLGVVDLAHDGLRIVTRLTESDPAKLQEGQSMAFTVVGSGWAFTPR